MSEHTEVGPIAHVTSATPGYEVLSLLWAPGSGYASATVIGWTVDVGHGCAHPVTPHQSARGALKMPDGRVFDAEDGTTFPSVDGWVESETRAQVERRQRA